MAMTPARGGKKPHPAWRARRVTAVVSGVAFAGLVGGMAIEATSSPAHASTQPNQPALDDTTQPTWGAPIAPQTVDPQTLDPQQTPQFFQPPVDRRSHTQTSGS
jgi:hypothetical protein